jgi:hypothetical protein
MIVNAYTGLPSVPELPTYVAPTYVAPERDEGRVRSLTQKWAAPGLRNLRQQVGKAMGANYTNPNVKRMTLREALAGYGQGIENVMAGAGRSALGEYSQEFAAKEREAIANFGGAEKSAMANYQGKLAGVMAAYQNQYKDYFAQTYGTGSGTAKKATPSGGVIPSPSASFGSDTSPSASFGSDTSRFGTKPSDLKTGTKSVPTSPSTGESKTKPVTWTWDWSKRLGDTPIDPSDNLYDVPAEQGGWQGVFDLATGERIVESTTIADYKNPDARWGD